MPVRLADRFIGGGGGAIGGGGGIVILASNIFLVSITSTSSGHLDSSSSGGAVGASLDKVFKFKISTCACMYVTNKRDWVKNQGYTDIFR